MYDSGVLFICNKENISDNGDMPVETLIKKNKYWFEMQTIGINRSYLAKGVNERVDLVVRVHGTQNISIHQYCVLGNGDQYRITLVSHGHEQSEFTRMVNQKYYKTARIVGLDYTELTLMKLEKNYALQTDEDKGCTC